MGFFLALGLTKSPQLLLLQYSLKGMYDCTTALSADLPLSVATFIAIRISICICDWIGDG